jgi:hypothetical protein
MGEVARTRGIAGEPVVPTGLAGVGAVRLELGALVGLFCTVALAVVGAMVVVVVVVVVLGREDGLRGDCGAMGDPASQPNPMSRY